MHRLRQKPDSTPTGESPHYKVFLEAVSPSEQGQGHNILLKYKIPKLAYAVAKDHAVLHSKTLENSALEVKSRCHQA